MLSRFLCSVLSSLDSVGVANTSVGVVNTSVGMANTSVGVANASVGMANTPVGVANTLVGVASTNGLWTTGIEGVKLCRNLVAGVTLNQLHFM